MAQSECGSSKKAPPGHTPVRAFCGRRSFPSELSYKYRDLDVTLLHCFFARADRWQGPAHKSRVARSALPFVAST